MPFADRFTFLRSLVLDTGTEIVVLGPNSHMVYTSPDAPTMRLASISTNHLLMAIAE